MSEILARLDRQDMADMTRQVERKAAAIRNIFAGAAAPPASAERLRQVLRSMFPTRRRAASMVAALGAPALNDALARLLWSEEDLEIRIAEVRRVLSDYPGEMIDLPWELLHLVDPERYWLWTRWMWNPRTQTGSLRLVTEEHIVLTATTDVATYRQVGRALAMVDETVRAIGSVADGPFGVDVFLACVYGIYMYTVLRMRMSQEFNRIVPDLPSLARRLLGIYKPEV